MKIFRGLAQVPKALYRPAVTIGNFDGVHLGHQALFRKVVELAAPRGGDTVAITFDPHPLKVLRPASPPKLISTFEQKSELIKKAGIQYLICLRFDMELAQTPAKDFVEKVFVKGVGVEDLVVGYDYAFGKGREGDSHFLMRMGRFYGFNVHVMDPVTVDGEIVSSTLVRQYVAMGKMRKVQRLLGRYYQIRGVVQVGKRRGGPVVGFPTANLAIEKEDLCPKTGVYCVQVIVGDRCFGGVMNIGYNPTFGDTGLSAEVHIFDFQEDIYGVPIKVNLIERIRDEMRFNDAQELRNQIAQDVEKARLIISSEKALKSACEEGAN